MDILFVHLGSSSMNREAFNCDAFTPDITSTMEVTSSSR